MSTRRKSKLTASLCVLAILYVPVHAAAEEVGADDLTRGRVTQLAEGQAAPFRGVLLSQNAAASLFGDLKFSQEECQLRLDKELQLNTLTLQAQIDVFALRLQIEEDRLQSLMAIKNERIEFLEKNWSPPVWYESGEFWLATGVITGIAVTVAAGYALGQASQ